MNATWWATGKDPLSPQMPTMLEWMLRVEAILRANKMHEPECVAINLEAALERVGHYPAPCDCWLSSRSPESTSAAGTDAQ